jgi:hypothetical protein
MAGELTLLRYGRTVLSTALLLACAETAPNELVLELREQPFRTLLSGGSDHGEMTEDALWFAREGVAEQLAEANEGTDQGSTQLLSRHHADNCRFADTFATLRMLHEQTVQALNPRAPRLGEAVRSFGSLTHTAQDFYAHSNWTESDQDHIVDRDHFYWPAATPGTLLGDMVVLGSGMPAGLVPTRASGSRVPRVVFEGVSRMGLISGTYPDNTDGSLCPAAVAIEHGPHVVPQWDAYDSYLAKDGPFSPHHDAAVDLAIEQTVEEFCRLDRLIRLRYGDAGHRFLMDTWVDDETGFGAECASNQSLVAGVVLSIIS